MDVGAGRRVGALLPERQIGLGHADADVFETLLGARNVVVAHGVEAEQSGIGANRARGRQFIPKFHVRAFQTILRRRGRQHLGRAAAAGHHHAVSFVLAARRRGQQFGPDGPIFLRDLSADVMGAPFETFQAGLLVALAESRVAGLVKACLSDVVMGCNQFEGGEAFVHAAQPFIVGSERKKGSFINPIRGAKVASNLDQENLIYRRTSSLA